MREVVFVVESKASNGWTAHCQAESIVTSADDLDGLRANIKEAVKWRFVNETDPVVIKIKVAQDRVFAN